MAYDTIIVILIGLILGGIYFLAKKRSSVRQQSHEQRDELGE